MASLHLQQTSLENVTIANALHHHVCTKFGQEWLEFHYSFRHTVMDQF